MPWGLITAITCTGIMLLINNYYYGLQNHLEHLPIILRFLDRRYLVNDFFVNSASTFGPRYYYALFAATLGKVANLPIIFLALTLISNISIGYVTYLTSLLIKPNRLRATIATMIVMGTTGITLGAASQLRQNVLEPSFLALSISLWGVYFSLKKQATFALALWVISSFIHPSLTLLIVIVSYISLTCYEKKVYPQAIIFAIIFGICWLLPNSNVLSSERLLYILANFRNPHHLLPSTFSPLAYILFGITLLTCFVAVKRYKQIDSVVKKFKCMIWISLLLLICGYVLVEIIPIRTMLPLQTFRLVAFVNWIAIIFITQLGAWWALAILILTMIGSKGDVLILLISSGLLYVMSRYHLRAYLLAILTGVIFFAVIWDRKSPLPLFDYVRPIITLTDTNTSEDKVEDYVRENTPRDAIILTPPMMGRMRLRGQRAIIADFKAVPYQEQALEEWYRRLQELYGPSTLNGYATQEEFSKNYLNISDDKINTIALKYQASYAVLMHETPTLLPIVYENTDYKLVKTIFE